MNVGDAVFITWENKPVKGEVVAIDSSDPDRLDVVVRVGKKLRYVGADDAFHTAGGAAQSILIRLRRDRVDYRKRMNEAHDKIEKIDSEIGELLRIYK